MRFWCACRLPGDPSAIQKAGRAVPARYRGRPRPRAGGVRAARGRAARRLRAASAPRPRGLVVAVRRRSVVVTGNYACEFDAEQDALSLFLLFYL